jgi:hypothetical protein
MRRPAACAVQVQREANACADHGRYQDGCIMIVWMDNSEDGCIMIVSWLYEWCFCKPAEVLLICVVGPCSSRTILALWPKWMYHDCMNGELRKCYWILPSRLLPPCFCLFSVLSKNTWIVAEIFIRHASQ